MTAKLAYTLSTLLFLASGLLYTLERILAYYIWIGQMQAASATGQFPTQPELPSLFTNGFVAFFLAASLFLLIVGIVFSMPKQPTVRSGHESGVPNPAEENTLSMGAREHDADAAKPGFAKLPTYLVYGIIAFLGFLIVVGVLNFVR
ncbi:hypothetical protein [Brevibacillus sp. SAFN-007a]|uniref:hypothetical protein n=1 Tax=Brevibacillus sp. SAFN-007a TaxID=3436862 RepID=UPI003F7E53F3